MTKTTDMSNEDLLAYLIDNANIPKESVIAYSAGYFESTLLQLMTLHPKVRDEIEYRVDYRRKLNGVQ